MKSLDIVLIRSLQFLVMLFFTFIVFLWYGFAALIPLALWLNLTEFFTGAFGPTFSTLLSLVLIGAFGYYLSKIPSLLETFLATGVDLIKLAATNTKRLGAIATSVNNNIEPQESKVEIVLKDKMS